MSWHCLFVGAVGGIILYKTVSYYFMKWLP